MLVSGWTAFVSCSIVHRSLKEKIASQIHIIDMANCIYCGSSAGFLRKRHPECEGAYATAISEAKQILADNNLPPEVVNDQIRGLLGGGEKQASTIRSLVIDHFEQKVIESLDDGILTEEEENTAYALPKLLEIEQADLDRSGAQTKLVKGAVLRDVTEGVKRSRIDLKGSLPFLIPRTENLYWVFDDVERLTYKTKRVYEGRSQGVSVRVMKGVYYRVGAFKGRPVDVTHQVSMGRGLLAITDKHLYFGGVGVRAKKLKLAKMLQFERFSDGICIEMDSATAKPEIFVTGDGWFTCNLIENLALNAAS